MEPTVEDLIKQAEELSKRAAEVIKHAPTHDPDYESAVHEVAIIGDLLKELRASPPLAKDKLKEKEVQLVKHEQTLKVLLDRLDVHSH